MVVSRQFWESISTDVDHVEVLVDEGLVVSDLFGLRGQAADALRLWEAIRESQTADVAENWSEFSEYVDCHMLFFMLLDYKWKQYVVFVIAAPKDMFELGLQRLCEVRMGSSPMISMLSRRSHTHSWTLISGEAHGFTVHTIAHNQVHAVSSNHRC